MLKNGKFLLLMLLVIGIFVISTSSADQHVSKINYDAALVKSKAHPKVGSNLLAEKPGAFEVQAQNMIKVVLELKDNTRSNIKTLEANGAMVEAIYKNLVQASIPASKLQAVSDLSFVDYVRSPLKAYKDAVVSEGAGVINASLFHNNGFKGQGVKVAIIDGGFAGYQSKLGTELPGNITVKSLRANGDIEGGGDDHGTAVAEIVYDIAPDAQLYLVNFETEIEFANAVDYAVSQDVDVISMSMGFLAGPFNGAGVIDDIVKNATSRGIIWVNSAGNFAQQHWEGRYSEKTIPAGADTWYVHNFGTDDETNSFYANAGDMVIAILSWNDWPRSNQDYDLYLKNEDTGAIVSGSENPQNGAQEPYEMVFYTVPTSGNYGLIIRKYSATQPVEFELYTPYIDNLQYRVEASSIAMPADARDVIAVGATHWSNDILEPFSSHGPTNDGRTKPDIAAPDGVSTSTYGYFLGTSASAPYVAGAVALLLQLDQSLSADELKQALEKGAKDLGAPGKDNQSGAGRIDIHGAYQQIDTAPPDVIITSPANNSFINTPDATVLGNVADNFGIASGCFEHFWQLGGTGCGGGEGNGGSGSYPKNITINQSVILHEGWNKLVFTYTDVAGNSGSASVNVTLDTGGGGRTIMVDDSGGANYTRIQDAIDNASAGDTIIVYSGTYYENVNVNKQLVLRGEDNGGGIPELDAEWIGNVVFISASGVTIDSFNIERSGGNSNAGIYIISSNNSVKNNNISENSFGIYLSNSNNNTISNNNISINIERGLRLYYSNKNNIINNYILNNFHGIELIDSGNNILSDNDASFNTNKGIRLYNSPNNELSGNYITNNEYGVELEYSSENTINDNHFKNNQESIPIKASANKWNVTKTSGKNIIGDPYLGGNFWANPSGTGFSQTCTDSDSDGICDSPYALDGSNIDYLPLAYNVSTVHPMPVSLPESRYVWDAALGANLTYTWTPMNFDGFFYDASNNVGNESLRIKLDSYSDRTIDMGDLIYTTMPEEVSFKHPYYGKYEVIGFIGEKYFAGYTSDTTTSIVSKSTLAQGQLHKVLIDDDTQRAVYAGSTLTLREGYVLKIKDVDITGGGIAALSLLKDGVEVDTAAVSAGNTYVYTRRIGNVSDLPIIAVNVESVFMGREANAAFIKGIFQISEGYTSVESGDKFGIMEIANVSGTGITMRNSNPLDLTRGSTIDIMGYLKFRVADSDILRFYPINFYYFYYYYGDYSNDYERRGSVSTVSNNITAWDALNFAGFWYDIDTGFYSESLKIFNISGRAIRQGDLSYTANAVRIPYIVTEEKGLIPEGTDGTYLAVGWVAEKQAAIKGKTSKISKIILEQRTPAAEKKTLTAGETWDMGEGWMLTAQSIDAKASPRQVWLVLSKDGVKKDDKIIAQGQVYTYVEKSIAGESDVPMFVTYVDSVFAGATTDMGQLRYTWLASENVTEINTGERFGVFNVTEISPGSIVLENDDPLSLDAGSGITLFGTLDFTVADAPELRFYPSKAFISPIPAPTYAPISISVNDGAVYTNKTTVALTLSAPGATEMSFKNESYNWTAWEPFTNTKSWTLSSGDGLKAVYFKARNSTVEFMQVSDDIILDTAKPEVANLSISTYMPIINEPVYISADVNDTNLKGGVSVYVRSPGGYINTLPMIDSGDGTYYCNFTNTSEFGRYYVSITAADLSGNINDTERTWFVTTMPPYINQSMNTTANNVTSIDASEKANTTLELVTSSDTTSGSINITMSNDIPPGMSQSFSLTPLGKYISINASENIRQNLTWIKLKFYYTKAELDASGLDEASLGISWYNESAVPYRWENLSTGSPQWVHGVGVETVDINSYAGYVWANISHLSTFALMGSYTAPAQTNPPGSGSGGGGGGGGGGGLTGENFSNIIVKENYDEMIFKDIVTAYRFKHPDNPVLSINITGSINAGLINGMVEVLKGTSTLVTRPPPGIVYRNANIWIGTSGFSKGNNIKEATITFRVNNSWISSNNLARNEIKLVRWDGTDWITLETQEKMRDDANTYYEAKTKSFSPFAMVGIKSVPSAAAQAITATVTAIPTGPSVTAGGGAAVDLNLIMYVLATFTIAAALYFLVVRKKK